MTIEVILFCSLFGLFILAAYTLGLRNGQKLSKKEEITVPNLNPINAVKEEIKRKEEQKEQEAIDVMLENINNYDGTGIGQRDIPNYPK